MVRFLPNNHMVAARGHLHQVTGRQRGAACPEATMRSRIIAQYERLQAALRSPHGRAPLVALLALALLLPGWWLASRLYERELLLNQRSHVASDLLPYAHGLTQQLHERFAILIGLKTYLALNPGAQSLTRATAVLTEMEGSQIFMIAPDGVVSYVHPPSGDDGWLGRNLIEDERPAVREDIRRAIRSRGITLSDPVELSADGGEWVAWLAVYRGEDLWGIVAVRTDAVEVLRQIDRDATRSWIQLALRDEAGRVVFGSEAVFEAEPVIHVVEYPDGRWQLAAIPKGGWISSILERLLMVEIAGLVIVLLLVSFMYAIINRQGRLERAVEQRTREISRVNEELREDIARREQVEAERQRLLEELDQRVAERTHHLMTLYDVTSVANASLGLSEMLERSLDRIVAALDSRVGIIQLRDPETGRLRVAASRNSPHEPCCRPELLAKEVEPCRSACWTYAGGEPLLVANTATDPRTRFAFSRFGARAHVGIPIRGKGELAGALCLFREVGRPFRGEEVSLLTAIAEQLGVAIENARLFAEAQEKATLEERQRLAAELHDSVTQLVYSEMLMAEAARQMVASGDLAGARQYLGRLGETAQQALKEMRLLLYELRLSGLTEEGLIAALQRRLDAVERRAGLEARLLVEGTVDLPRSVQEELYHVALEALNNTLKHAGATSVAVEVRRKVGLLEMSISDNGRGFDPNTASNGGGLGLTTMRERAERLGASLVMGSTENVGTVVQVKVPLPRDSEGSESVSIAVGLAEVS